MKNAEYVFDACSIINLIHIDDNDFLFKRMKKLGFVICEKVHKEIQNNIFSNLLFNENDNEIRKEIEIKLTKLKSHIRSNKDILDDNGNDYFNFVKEFTQYNRENGEFYSVALTLELSRWNENKMFFVTDDYKAKYQFSNFFSYQQIGHIEDSCDFLVFLYWLNNGYNIIKLKRYLRDLLILYRSEISIFQKKIRDFNTSIGDNRFKVKKYRQLLVDIDHTIREGRFDHLYSIYTRIISHKEFKQIVSIFELYPCLTSNIFSNEYLEKISKYISSLSLRTIYKVS